MRNMAAVEGEPGDSAVLPRSYSDLGYRHGFLGVVCDLQKAGVLQDVVVDVQARRFPCHRLVLSAASPYFRAMFTSDMAESRQKTVLLQGLDPDSLEEIMSYIYSGTLHVSLDSVQPLYQAADLLQVDYVRETCVDYMAMNVEHSTCLDLYMFADAFSVWTVKERCLQCICRHFVKVSATAEFCSLSVDQLTEIISQDGLDVKEETTVWEAVVRWVEHRREDRQHHLPSILPHIRFNLMTSDDMATILEHALIKEVPGSSEVIRNMVQKGADDLKLRYGMDTQEMALFFNSGSTNILLCMNPQEEIHICCPFRGNTPCVKSPTVTGDNNIFALAQRGENEIDLLMYNHMGHVWERESSSVRWSDYLVGNYEHLVEVDGLLYYITVEMSLSHDRYVVMKMYNPHTKQWQKCALQQVAESELEMVVSCSEHIYFITNGEMFRYHPREDLWSRRTPPRILHALFYVVSIGTEIYCTDGRDFQTIAYSTTSDSWRRLPDFPRQRIYPADHYEGHRAFVLGGQLHILVYSKSVSVNLWRVFVYDSSSDAWRDLNATIPNMHLWVALGDTYCWHVCTCHV